MQFENFALKTNVLAFASRSKAKANPQRRALASSSTRTSPIKERKWTDVEPEDHSLVAFFVMVIYFEKMMERLNSGDYRNVFGTILCNLNIGLMKSGVQLQKAGKTRKNFNIVLIHQDKKFFISELFKVIQDAISLILHYRTMYQFRTISSSTFLTSDVKSIYTPS